MKKLEELTGEEAKQAIKDWETFHNNPFLLVLEFDKKYNIKGINTYKDLERVIDMFKEKVKNEKKDEKKEDYKTMTYADLMEILRVKFLLDITGIKVRGDWIEKPEEETFKLCYEVKKK